MIACGEAETNSVASASPSVTTAASNSSAPAVSSDVVPAVTSATAPSSAPPIASSWFGPAPSDKSLLDPPIAVYRGKFNALLSVPEGWTHARLTDGMSENLFGLIARPTDKSAVVIVIVHEATHESLLEFGAERWLGISGGARDLAWGKVQPAPGAGDEFSLRRGRGKLWGKLAEVVQLRRRVPSVEKGPHTLLLLGAVADTAPAARRDAYVACLASYAVSVP